MSKNLSQPPQNCCSRRRDCNSSRLEKQKLRWKIQCQKSRGLPNENLILPPTTAIDPHTITVKRDSIHPFPQNLEFTRRLEWPSTIRSCSRPDQSFFRFSHKHEELRHPTNRYPASASSTWCHPWGALVLRAVLINIYSTRLSWNRRYPSLENSTHAVSNK